MAGYAVDRVSLLGHNKSAKVRVTEIYAVMIVQYGLPLNC